MCFVSAVIEEREARAYLAIAREVSQDHALVDMHVHATEVIFGKLRYQWSGPEASLVSGHRAYVSPQVSRIRIDGSIASGSRQDKQLRARLSEVLFTRAYEYIGARVLLDQMELSCCEKAVLLPVASDRVGLGEQLQVLRACAGASDRFYLAYSVPGEVPDEDATAHLRQARAEHDVRAVKLHPNLSGIDPGTARGVARIESILQAANELDLPVIVHGGRSPILTDQPGAEFSLIEKLQNVDWSISSSNVIIAHFGSYGCSDDEQRNVVLPGLDKLLRQHDHLLTDCSGLAPAQIAGFLRHIDVERVVFGSDALYVPQWQALVGFMHALDAVHLPVARSLARCASTLPLRALGEERQRPIRQ
jgi:predicted TIM-barrel fold metal-dependent hydrolase